MEVTYRFKGLDLVSRVSEELTTETEVCNIVQEYQTIPKALEWGEGEGMQKGKVWRGFTNSWGKKRNENQEAKGKKQPIESRDPENSKER